MENEGQKGISFSPVFQSCFSVDTSGLVQEDAVVHHDAAQI